MTKYKKIFLKNYFSGIADLILDINLKQIENLRKIILKTSKKKGSVYLIGNGGSNSTANHISVDLLKNAKIKTVNSYSDNLITCFSNDYGYENWVKKYFEYMLNKNDLVIFLSVSGNSKNLINGAKYLIKKKINFFSLTGTHKNNNLNKLSKNKIWVQSKSYNYVEIVHFIILASVVDSIIGKVNYKSNL